MDSGYSHQSGVHHPQGPLWPHTTRSLVRGCMSSCPHRLPSVSHTHTHHRAHTTHSACSQTDASPYTHTPLAQCSGRQGLCWQCPQPMSQPQPHTQDAPTARHKGTSLSPSRTPPLLAIGSFPRRCLAAEARWSGWSLQCLMSSEPLRPSRSAWTAQGCL